MLRRMIEESLIKSHVIEMCILHNYLEQKKKTKAIALEMETSLPSGMPPAILKQAVKELEVAPFSLHRQLKETSGIAQCGHLFSSVIYMWIQLTTDSCTISPFKKRVKTLISSKQY